MSGQLSNDHLTYIKAKCKAEGLVAFLSVPEGNISPSVCSNCGGDGEIPVTFARASGSGFPYFWRGNIRYVMVDHASFSCPVCKSTNEQKINFLLNASGVPSHEWGWEIHHIAGIPGKENAYEIAKLILSQAPLPKGLYLFYGDYGMGKSGLLKSLIVSMAKAGVPSLYVGSADILSAIKATYNQHSSATEVDIVSYYLDARILAIDEVDVVASTDWSLSTLRTLLDKRYESRSINCTLLATNRPPDQIWPYLASRCEDGYRIPVSGPSLRGNNIPTPHEPDGEPMEKAGDWWNHV